MGIAIVATEYDKNTGELAKAFDNGQVVRTYGSNSGNGYKTTTFGGRTVKVHRLAVFLVTGEWPAGEVDHVNGDRSDNRWDNLRVLTREGNIQNQRRPHSTNSTGMLGVYPQKGRFRAQINVRGVQKYLGSFATPEEAHAVYVAAKREFHLSCTI